MKGFIGTIYQDYHPVHMWDVCCDDLPIDRGRTIYTLLFMGHEDLDAAVELLKKNGFEMKGRR